MSRRPRPPTERGAPKIAQIRAGEKGSGRPQAVPARQRRERDSGRPPVKNKARPAPSPRTEQHNDACKEQAMQIVRIMGRFVGAIVVWITLTAIVNLPLLPLYLRLLRECP